MEYVYILVCKDCFAIYFRSSGSPKAGLRGTPGPLALPWELWRKRWLVWGIPHLSTFSQSNICIIKYKQRFKNSYFSIVYDFKNLYQLISLTCFFNIMSMS